MMLPMENFQFISKLIKKFITDRDDGHQNFDRKSFVFSPSAISTTMALGLYLLTDAGKEIQKAIMGELTTKEDFLNKIFDRIRKVGVEASLLNQILIDSRNFALEELIVRELRSSGREECFKNIDFSNVEQLMNVISQWILKATNGQIKSLISSGQLDSNAGILMTSIGHFSGLWSDHFTVEKTKNQTFHVTSEITTNLDVMSRMDDKGWFEDNDVQILEWDLQVQSGSEKMSMIFLLPQQRNGLRDLILNKMTGSKLNDWINSTHVTNVWMEIPRFKVDNTFMLDHLLTEIGVKNFFDESQIFDGIKTLTSKKPKVSGFYHGAHVEGGNLCRIEYFRREQQKCEMLPAHYFCHLEAFLALLCQINEQGVNAPSNQNTAKINNMAADGPRVEEQPPPQVPKRFIADHPFIFLITVGDRDDKMILLMGQFYGQT